MKKNQKKGIINFKINLDANNIPENIIWEATDQEGKQNQTKAIMISIWDGHNKSSLKIDLWTKEMMVEEMKFFTFQILDALGDTYKRATNDENTGNEIKNFAKKMGKMSKVLK